MSKYLKVKASIITPLLKQPELCASNLTVKKRYFDCFHLQCRFLPWFSYAEGNSAQRITNASTHVVCCLQDYWVQSRRKTTQ